MIYEIKYRIEGDEEGVLLTDEGRLTNDPAAAAGEVAKDHYDRSSPDLHDPSSWPITYEVFHNGEWIRVDVAMEYSPDFSGSVISNDICETDNER